MHGHDVRDWLGQLAKLGWNANPDGRFRPHTEAVCRAFQRRCGLEANGKVGPETWKAAWERSELPVETGLDSAFPPSVEGAKAARAATGATWWGIYIGGPCAAHAWGPDAVRELGQLGFFFMPIYVGQNLVRRCTHRTLTAAQGRADADEATRLMPQYGWPGGRRIPVCLDVERNTFDRGGRGALAYIGAWSKAARGAGYRPVLYTSVDCVKAVARLPNEQRPGAVWTAIWTREAVDHTLDPRRTKDVPAALWKGRQRAWQYVGDTRVAGVGVDISCSNLPLAPPPV